MFVWMLNQQLIKLTKATKHYNWKVSFHWHWKQNEQSRQMNNDHYCICVQNLNLFKVDTEPCVIQM